MGDQSMEFQKINQNSIINNNFNFKLTKYIIFLVKPNNTSLFKKFLFFFVNKKRFKPKLTTILLTDYRFQIFLNCFVKKGKKLRMVIFFFNLIQLIRFKLKCKSPLLLLLFVLRILEPFFEFRTIKRKRRVLQIVLINSLKRRVFLASKFFFEGVMENLKKKKDKKKLLLSTLEEMILLINKSRFSNSLKKYRTYNKLLKKSRFLSDKKSNYVSKFPR